MDLTNREKASKCLATSSLLVVGQLPPPAVMFCFKELLWASRILQAYIKCSAVCLVYLSNSKGGRTGHFNFRTVLLYCGERQE